MTKKKILNSVYNTLWGSSEIPENWMISFIMSNAIYILYGIVLLFGATGDVLDSDRFLRAWLILLVGFASTIFHSNQVIHGHSDKRTSVFHFFDISIAIGAFIIAVWLRGIENVPTSVYYLIALSVPFYLYNGKYYGLFHSIWHIISATILFIILNY
jgi:hypothetical protein